MSEAQEAAATEPATLRTLFRDRPFGFYIANRVVQTIAMSVQTATITWQVYEITGSALPLAAVGVIRFIPAFILSFVGGAVADTRDRRWVLGLSQIPPILISLLLWWSTLVQADTLTLIYVTSAVLGMAGAFEGPARQSLLPQVVPRPWFQRAVTVGTTIQQLARILGPSAAGFLIYALGVAPAYLAHVALAVAGLVLLAGIALRERSPRRSGGISLVMVLEGLAYVWNSPAVLGAIALDLFAVIFASAEALLPIYANDILGVGAQGYGLLNSARGVGAFAASAVLTALPPIVATGRTMVLTVAVFGLATAAFGLSPWFPLSLLFYGISGAADQVSVVMRQSIIQLSTPDELRGRVNSVYSVSIGASGQLGAVESGLVSTWTNPVFAVVSGGVGCVLSLVVIVRLLPQLWRHQTGPTPTAGTEKA
ncbi:MAG: MFS transporter [Dehalococcoidia bacterium]|nr:MFS transporter [Dehalococcoidia bacterium]